MPGRASRAAPAQCLCVMVRRKMWPMIARSSASGRVAISVDFFSVAHPFPAELFPSSMICGYSVQTSELSATVPFTPPLSHHLHHAPDADAGAVVAPGIVEHVRNQPGDGGMSDRESMDRSNRKCSIFGTTHSATRAPLGQRSGGRCGVGEYAKRLCASGTAGGTAAAFLGAVAWRTRVRTALRTAEAVLRDLRAM